MREHQFAEDAGPMSHPIRPDEVIEMSNFYTVTVYDKGAEVIRMLHTLLGKSGFRKGMDEYFIRHDGQAVTCDDFVNAMQDANEVDLSHFKRWYSQSGTPVVKVEQQSIGQNQTSLTFTQINKPTPGQKHKQDLYIPIKLGCFLQNGQLVDTKLDNDTLILDGSSSTLHLDAPSEQITPSLLQNFSAPVLIEYEYTLAQLLIILEHSSNDYAKWEASQNVYVMLIKKVYNTDIGTSIRDDIEQLARAIEGLTVAPEVLAQVISVPSTESLYSQIEKVDPIKLYHARHKVLAQLSEVLEPFCTSIYVRLSTNQPAYAYEKQQVNDRSLKNTCLYLLTYSTNKDASLLIQSQYQSAHNMSDRLGALKAAEALQGDVFNTLMLEFEKQFEHDAVVMDKWFAMHGKSNKIDILAHLDLLQAHRHYSIKNPNKVRSLIGSFAFYNTLGFHQLDGSGYKYLTDYLISLDKINPQVASRLITPLMQFSSFADTNQVLIKKQLNRLFGVKGLSKDLCEKISKALTQ
jgi:aminopeptidase N